MFHYPLYLFALVDSLAVVLLDSLVFFFCWVAEGFRSSCSSGSGAGGSLWSASELPLLVLGLSSSDLCLSLDIVGNFLGKEKRQSYYNRKDSLLSFPKFHWPLPITGHHAELFLGKRQSSYNRQDSLLAFPKFQKTLNRWQVGFTEKLIKIYSSVSYPRAGVWQLQSNIYTSENTDISNF